MGNCPKVGKFFYVICWSCSRALAHTNVLGNALFGSISSSAIAASTAIGGVLIPQQVNEGYDRKFATAVNIASAYRNGYSTKYSVYYVFIGGWWGLYFFFIFRRLFGRFFVGVRNYGGSLCYCKTS